MFELQLQHQSFHWHSGLISFRIDWFDLLAVQGTLVSLPSTTFQKHRFFGAQPSLLSSSHICTWLLEKMIALTVFIFVCQVMSLPFWYTIYVCHSFLSCFLSKKQASCNLMAVVTVHSDFGAQENKIGHCFHFFPSICHEVIGLDAMIFILFLINFY